MNSLQPVVPADRNNCETVKERVCFYSCRGRSQQVFRNFISPVFNRVQPVHRGMPDFGAILKTRIDKVSIAGPISRSSSQRSCRRCLHAGRTL